MRLIYTLLGILMLLLVSGCIDSSLDQEACNGITCSVALEPKEGGINKLEIYHFHSTNQCYSCITVGNYAEETVNTYFKEELDKGIIVFDHINIDIIQNAELVKKYGTTGSSLWLGTYKGDEFKAEENTNVWYKIKDKQDYMNYLKEIIEQKLAGN